MAACRPGLRGRAIRHLPRKLAGKEDASDLVQRVMLRATTDIERFRGRSIGEFYTWLARILDAQILHVLRHWRTQRRDWRREDSLSPAWCGQGDFAASSTSVSDRVAREEEIARLRFAAGWFPEPDRTIIFLYSFEGLSHEEIAERLEIAPPTVRQRYSRAVGPIREAMELLELMNRRGLSAVQQDVIGLHRFRHANAGQIAAQLRLPESLAARWIAEARPLLRATAKDGP
jgi:RNA polymerase sigma-70 factor (ECF subfamily)